jgi:hypothetical protein
MSPYEWLREQWETGHIWVLLIAFGIGAGVMLIMLMLLESVS